MKHTRKTYILWATFLMALLVSCSTENTKWVNVQYHNITCHYNVWWNGNESLKEGVRKLQKKAEDDYTQILPVYQLGTQEQALTVKPQMDRAIEKGVKGIKTHSIYKKGHEWVSYVKNCYLLSAYGSFYEQDYASTDNTCRIIISQYAGTQEADEAKILLARSQVQQKQYAEGEQALDALVRENEEGDLHKSMREKLYLAMVECCLPQEKYKKTVQYLRLALDEVHDRQTKARLYYIMAQIYQKLDKRATAQRYYQQVLKCKPTYVMEFNARINQAACSDMKHTDVQALNKSLDKMLRDKKNEEYRDQIYYAKGDMYLGVKDVQKACDNYKLAVQAARPKSAMKAKAALKMADVLYDIYENYDAAQSYYDTAMRVITVDYPHYDEIRDRHYLLTSLVEFTRVISTNDSLIMVADMDSVTRVNYILQKIEERKQEEAAEKERQFQAQLAAERASNNPTLEGDWYFYNSRTVTQGKEAFRKNWGNRILEDYWFLSTKTPNLMSNLFPDMMAADEDNTAQDSASLEGIDNTSGIAQEVGALGSDSDPYSVAYYLKGLPKTQEERDSMHYEEGVCLLNAGYIYNEGIKNTERALECYLRMANEFSDDPQIVQTFYQLYRIYSNQGNTPQANYYRDMVLMGFPDSDYANLIRDDEYYKEIIKRQEKAQTDYAAVYRAYQRGRYNEVISNADRALFIYSEEPLMGKFKYWKGMALLRNNERDTAKQLFQNIVNTYPDTSQLVILAKAQLDFIARDGVFLSSEEEITPEEEQQAKRRYNDNNRPARVNDMDRNGSATGSGNADLPPESAVYRYRESMQHYVVVLLNDKKIVATQMQYKISDFNLENYSNSGYRASPQMFTDSLQMITIHRFNTAADAMLYYKHIQLPGGPLEQYDKKDYTIFAISIQNYTTFFNRKNIEAYLVFFRRYYLEK